MEDIELRIQRKCSEIEDIHPARNELKKMFYEFQKIYLKMIVLSARENIIKLLNYLNVFRSIQKNISNAAKDDFLI